MITQAQELILQTMLRVHYPDLGPGELRELELMVKAWKNTLDAKAEELLKISKRMSSPAMQKKLKAWYDSKPK